jgi:hypothetical protein
MSKRQLQRYVPETSGARVVLSIRIALISGPASKGCLDRTRNRFLDRVAAMEKPYTRIHSPNPTSPGYMINHENGNITRASQPDMRRGKSQQRLLRRSTR